jgi:integration host factor subunit alpha
MPKTSKAVTRVDLYEAVYQKVGLSRTESSAFVELVLQEITDCLEKGETVKLSSFGSFMVREKGRRLGRNPKTGIEVLISPRRVVVFKPSAIMKQQINSQPPGSSAVACAPASSPRRPVGNFHKIAQGPFADIICAPECRRGRSDN